LSTRRTTPELNPKKISRAGSSSQESLVEALLEGMGEGFFAFDPDWRFTAFNGAAEEIFGVPRREVDDKATIFEIWGASRGE
jgi:PAS domain-containing protein